MADETEHTEAAEAQGSSEALAEASASEETAAAAAESSEAAPVEEAAPAESAEAQVSGDEAPAKTEKVAPITATPRRQRLAEEREARKLAEAGGRPQRTPEERQAERDQQRKQKAAARTHQRGKERAAYRAAEHERKPTPPREHVVGNKKVRQGIVVSDKADKTITVRIEVARPHRRYRKIVRTSTTFHAHDERNDAHIGDTVVIQESRPLSATKRWRLAEIVERAR